MSARQGVIVFTMVVTAACSTAMPQTKEERWSQERQRMVDQQLRARDISSAPVLEVMGRVPRHMFVPEEDRSSAYTDYPLPIGFGQTISQPYIVAFMSQALEVRKDHRVLEIGTGSGYQAA